MNIQTKITPAASVYAKIAAVQGELSKIGIAKNRRNSQGSGYNFRGIDDVYSALSPLLAQHGLVIVPRIVRREVVERSSRGGGALFYVTVHAEFDFISADDGSIHTAATFGEAMDSGDKATNKAMSAAYKYAAFMTFAIPTEGDNDADATTHEIVAERPAKPAAKPQIEGPINDPEWAIITDLIQQTNSDTKAFCTAFKITSVKELPAAQFERARTMLNKKLAAMVEEPA